MCLQYFVDVFTRENNHFCLSIPIYQTLHVTHVYEKGHTHKVDSQPFTDYVCDCVCMHGTYCPPSIIALTSGLYMNGGSSFQP